MCDNILDTANPILAKNGVSYQYQGESSTNYVSETSFAKLAVENSGNVFNVEQKTIYDTIVRVDVSGVKIYRNLGGTVAIDTSAVTLDDVLITPTIINEKIGLDGSELSAIKRIRAEIEYDLASGVKGTNKSYDFINAASISIPDESMIDELSNGTLTELRAAPGSNNAWDLSNNGRHYKYIVENVLGVTALTDDTMGKLLIKNDAALFGNLEAAGGPISQVHVTQGASGSPYSSGNTIQFDVSMGASGTIDENGLTDAFMALFDLSGIDILNSTDDGTLALGGGINASSSYEEKLAAYLGTDGSGSNFVYWEMIPHNAGLDSSVDYMSIKYDITAEDITYSYPVKTGDNLRDLAKEIELNPYAPAKYKIVLYLREGAVMRKARDASGTIVAVNPVGYKHGTFDVYATDRSNKINLKNPVPIDQVGGLSALENTVNGASKTAYAVLNILVRSPVELLTFTVKEHKDVSGTLIGGGYLDRTLYDACFNAVQISVNRSDGSANLLDYSGNDVLSVSLIER
jgi:hypothetical protein